MDSSNIVNNFSAINLKPEVILGPEGPIAQQFENYEPRPPQTQMAEAVEQNFNKLGHLFCEAGTGTGKSYAFLIPAIKAALSGEAPIVVSTNTISLQEQIFYKDIPDLKRFLNLPNLRVVLRKGRGNYISIRRHKNAQNYEWTTDEITEMEDIDNLIDETKTGSLQDINPIPSNEIWAQVRSDQYDCLGQKCPAVKKCFYFKSKEEAEKAHIIICNHALLALDLNIKAKTDNNVNLLPKYKHLIIDEAHALEDAIRKSETFEWKQNSAATLAKLATNRKNNGFLDLLMKISGVSYNIITHANEAIKNFKHFVELNFLFFENEIKNFIYEGRKSRRGIPPARRVKPGNLVSKRSDDIIRVIGKINQYLSSIVSNMKRLTDDEFISKDVKQLAVLLEKYKSRIFEVESELSRAINAKKDMDQPYPTHVSSIEPSKFNGKVYSTLISTPIFVRQISQKILFSKIPSILLTSATLTINNNFKHIIQNLGAIKKKAFSIQLPPLFDYKNQTKIILTPKIPLDPWNNKNAREKYFDIVSEKVEKYLNITKGNALVLCTSNIQSRALFERLFDSLNKNGIYALRQGDGLTRRQLIEELKMVQNSVIFGVDSFWTGVDVPGDHLQNIIIPKLPFSPPTPLSEAQQEMYNVWNKGKTRNKQRNYFAERTIPEVAIKLQQGFGRLIRHRSDKGIVVIMDPRMKTKAYGSILLNSLPKCKVIIDN